MGLLAGPPAGPEIELVSTPQVLSWDAKGSVPQERLIPYQDELRRVAGPLVADHDGLSVNLRAAFSAKDLHFGRDLDNLLDPVVVALGPEHFVGVWGTKAEGGKSAVSVGPPTPIDGDALGGWYRARANLASFTDFKPLVAAQLAGRIPLPGNGSVELIVAFTIGLARAWRNLWKPSIDVLGGILGRNGGEWAPKDERIVRLGLTYEVDASLGHGMRIDYWYRVASAGPISPSPRRVVGIDAFSKGWVAIELRDGAFAKAGTAAGLAELVALFPGALVYGVDMPIGFAPVGGRAADDEARKFVGARSSSVFPTPPRAALEAKDFEQANVIAKGLTGKGLSQQSWALRTRIIEANLLASSNERLIEVHPEASFRDMSDEPLANAKTTWNGQAERRALLATHGIRLPDDLGSIGSLVPSADVLDAAAAAWSADRMALGLAQHFPEALPTMESRAVAIWY